ncbi:Regulator of MON1-CCZ1 complex [Schistosoma haematobium]|uniref:Regulator of MON1-CCZ1 complex n=1 Tax=Schistosoma haematobium TaxID=6185 RepID=A0A922LNT3_SCHHA|nr:Regulator of MON1-CCZ1 complex [Schistosoma haematobium]KAH9590474.1 Regulator of MON1-CCZ1 complex [Schistosoma haematobium]
MVHYQSRKVTSVFDIALNGTVRNVIHHSPILRDISIAPFSLFTKIIPSLSTNLDAQIPIDLYSMNWIIHLCGVVIDNSLGCSWLLCLNTMVFPKLIANHNLVVDFLLHRSSGKSVLLEYCSKLALDSIEEVTSNVDKPLNYKFDGYGLNQRLDQFAFVFKRICEVGYCGTNVMSKLLTDSDRKMPSASEASCHCSIAVSDALNLMWINTFLLPILRRLYLNHIQLLHIFLYCTDLIQVVSSHISHYLKYIRNKTYDPKSFTGDE